MSDTFSPDFASMGERPPEWSAKRPIRVVLLGDFGAGASRGRLRTADELGRQKPIKVEYDTLEDAMQRLDLSLTLPLGGSGAPITIELPDLDAFHPDAIYACAPVFADLALLRQRLNTASQFAKAAAEVSVWAEGAGPRASSLARAARPRGSAPPRGATLDDFARLTGRASTATSGAGPIADLLQRVVGPFVQAATSPNKDALVAAVDAGLSDAMRALLHHPDFQTTESLWRGVDFLLRRLETGPQLEVHLIDISAEELAADLSGASDLADTGLYRLLVRTPAEDPDGGYTYIAGCYQFEATPPHAELLGRAAQIASHAGASLLTGMATDAFADRKEPPHRLVQEAFDALCALPSASFLGLVGPRFLLRHPYGKKSDPITSFAFEEFSREAGLGGMLWGHPALLALTVLAREGAPLTIDDLPFHHFVDADGDSVALPCTERMITANIASLLRSRGINAVMAHKGEALVRFNGLEAVNGDGLAMAGAAPRKAPREARFTVNSGSVAKAASKGRADESPAVRRGRPAEVAIEENTSEEQESNETTEDQPIEEASTASEDRDETAPVSSDSPAADDELATLLASLEEPVEAAGDGANAEPAMDPDLDALLKSLG